MPRERFENLMAGAIKDLDASPSLRDFIRQQGVPLDPGSQSSLHATLPNDASELGRVIQTFLIAPDF